MLRISLIAAALVLAACTPPADRQEAEGAPQDAATSDITVPADLLMPPEEADVPPATGMAPVLPPAEHQPPQPAEAPVPNG